MTVYTEILGNINRDHEWAHKIEDCDVDYVILDQWTAQKSRFLGKGLKMMSIPWLSNATLRSLTAMS